MAWSNEWTTEQRRWLGEQFEASRRRRQPKRSRFATEVGVNDSTVQVLEFKKAGNISEAMVDFLTERVGWPKGHWRRVMEDMDLGEPVDAAEATAQAQLASIQGLADAQAIVEGGSLREGINVAVRILRAAAQARTDADAALLAMSASVMLSALASRFIEPQGGYELAAQEENPGGTPPGQSEESDT